MSSAVAFHARTFRSVGEELASRAREAVSGSSSRESFASFDPASSSWKTSQLSCLAEETACSLTLPRRGTMRSGRLYEPRTLERLTSERGYSSSRGAWPTPSASLPNDGESAETWVKRAARLKEKHNNGNGAGMPLAVAVQLWPTPGANDHKGSCAPGQRRGQLDEATENEPGAARLNPSWVEALMGLPAGWTDPGPHGAESRNTRGSRSARRRREEPQE
jgi:hypothetical protein